MSGVVKYQMDDLRRILTERWFPYPITAKEHKVLQKLKSDVISRAYYFYIVAAGRRSFKTEFIKRDFVYDAISRKNEIYYLGAPTRAQAKDIFWNDIKALSPWYLIKDISETALRVTYITGTTIEVVGLKEFKRRQGLRAHKVGTSETQDCSPQVYTETFQPMLNDTGGIFIGEGRPFGKNHFYDWYLRGVNKDKGCSSYHWTSKEILTEEQIERALRELSKEDYEREYNASFDTQVGRPYHAYSQLNHIKGYEWNMDMPFITTCDFNATVKPMSWAVGQKAVVNGKASMVWKKTLQFQYTNTLQMCKKLDEYYKTLTHYPLNVWFYGDFAGEHDSSNSSVSDWDIIRKYFNNKTQIKVKLKPCLSVRDSIASTNGQLQNVYGEVRQYLDPVEAIALKRDYEYAEWAKNELGLAENKDMPEIGHVCRAVDYYNDFETPVRESKITTTTGVWA